MANLHQLLKAMIEKGASDLHITTSSPPQLRIDGKLHPLKMPPLSPPETKQLCYSILTDAQKHRFEEENELDLSFGVKSLARFRAWPSCRRERSNPTTRASRRASSQAHWAAPHPSSSTSRSEVSPSTRSSGSGMRQIPHASACSRSTTPCFSW